MSDYDEQGPGEYETPDPYLQLNELGYSPEETAATRQVLQGVIDHHVREAIEPVQRDLEYVTAQIEAEEHEAALADLETAYPALRNDAVAEQVLAAARDYAEQQGDPSLATDPETIELIYLRGQSGGAQRQQAQRSSPGVVRGNALAFDQGTPESEQINAAIIAKSGRTNVWDRDY